MTYRLEALEELKAKVEAGEEVSARDASRLWPNGYAHAVNAGHGSLDAAMALHNAVLSGCMWRITPRRCVISDVHGNLASIRSDTPARAWLLAILSALIAQEQANE